MGRLERILLMLLLACACQSIAAAVPAHVKQALASRDYDTAIAWLESNRAVPEAAFELGKLYRLGRGVEQDHEQAAACFTQAADAGHLEAQYLLGKHYERAGDPAAAAGWMARAAAAGHSGAQAWTNRSERARSEQNVFTLIRNGESPPRSGAQLPFEQADAAGRTPLILAAATGDLTWVRFLLEQGVNPNAMDTHGASALHAALAGRHESVAGVLIDHGVDLERPNAAGNTPLHIAVSTEQPAMVRRLLAAGADPDAENNAGWSPRTLAARSRRSELHQLLGVPEDRVGRPVSLASGEQAGPQALDAARRGDEQTLGQILRQGHVRPKTLTPALHDAARNGRAGVLDQLLDAGVDVDARDARARSALMIACESNCSDCVERLIKAGADLEARDEQGRSALHMAARLGHLEAVRALVSNGAPLDGKDDLGRNALWWSSHGGQTALALLLLDLGVAIEGDAQGIGPLHLAAGNDDARLIAALASKVGVSAPAGDGNLPLAIAARAGAAEAVTALLDAGAPVDERNTVGDTALIVAVRAGQLAVAEQLVRAGASTRIRNDRFESAAALIQARDDPAWQALLDLADSDRLGLFGSITN